MSDSAGSILGLANAAMDVAIANMDRIRAERDSLKVELERVKQECADLKSSILENAVYLSPVNAEQRGKEAGALSKASESAEAYIDEHMPFGSSRDRRMAREIYHAAYEKGREAANAEIARAAFEAAASWAKAANSWDMPTFEAWYEQRLLTTATTSTQSLSAGRGAMKRGKIMWLSSSGGTATEECKDARAKALDEAVERAKEKSWTDSGFHKDSLLMLADLERIVEELKK